MPYLIDGHNLIGQMPGLRLADPDDEQKLIEHLRTFMLQAGKTGVVIFDKGLPGGAGKWSTGALEVRFAPHPKTADDLIRDRLQRERNPRGLIVVSSDREVMAAARQAGAACKTSREFAQELLTPRPGTSKKETGLNPAEVAAWEAEFSAKNSSTPSKSS